MKIIVIDGQGGNIGRQLVKSIKDSFPNIYVRAVGTNSAATANMLKGGADEAATGENAFLVACREADIIVMLCGQRTFRAQKRPVLGLEDIEIGEIVGAGIRAEHIGSGLLSHSDGHIGHAGQRFCVGADGILHDTGDLRRNSKCDFSAAVVGIVLRDRIGDGRS